MWGLAPPTCFNAAGCLKLFGGVSLKVCFRQVNPEIRWLLVARVGSFLSRTLLWLSLGRVGQRPTRTVGGFRYLYFPNVKDCCKCCTYTAGTYECGGPVGPQWLNNATGNLQYLGREEILGRTCHKWSVEGVFPGHLNYYFEDVASGRPCGIDGYNYLRTPAEAADDQYLFEVDGLNLTVDPSTFRVPDVCRDSRYCGGKVCASGPDQATVVHL
eukprot:s530_g2.t2